MSRTSAPWGCAVVLLVATGAGAARASTLADVIAYAYETSPALQSQRAAQRALDESYVQARAGMELSAQATLSQTTYGDRFDHVPPSEFLSNSAATTATDQLSITQPLYTGGRVASQISEAEAHILAGRQNLREADIEFIEKVVGAYCDVLRDQSLLKLAEDTVQLLEREEHNSQARFDVREVTRTDVAQTSARRAQAQAELAAARQALNSSRAEFIGVVGESPGTLEPLPPLGDLPDTIDKALEASEANNPQLLSVKYTEQQSRAKVAEAKAGVLPSISLQVTLQHSPYLPYTGAPYQSVESAALVLSQPLFAGGQIASTIRQASEENNHDRLAIDDVRLQLIQQVASTWGTLTSQRDQLTSLQESTLR